MGSEDHLHQGHVKTVVPLTSIRGIAVFWVYLYHCQFLNSKDPFLSTLVGAGYYGVDIFFLLSGFIISYVHLKDFPNFAAVKAEGLPFLRLRLARIYPLHLATLMATAGLIYAGVIGITGDNTPRQFAYNLLLMQAWPFSKTFSFNLISWSISVEWALYLAFPLFACAVAAKARDILSNLLVIALCLALLMWHRSAAGIDVASMYVPGESILRGAFGFTVGAALHNLYRLRVFARLPWDHLALAIPPAVLFYIWLRSRETHIHEVFLLMLFAAWIYALANASGFAQRLYSWHPLVYLGTIAYSLYMWQFLIGAYIWQHALPLLGERSFLSWQFLVMTCVYLGIASLSFHFIEDPIRRCARRGRGR